jgi:diguanylate cyclase (GGDEF)-like protein
LDSDQKNTIVPAYGRQGTALARALDKSEQGTALARALDKSEQVQSKVTECAEELSSVNINIKEEIVRHSPAERVRPALERIEKVEEKVQECADDLLAVNETLKKEIAERKHLEHLLAHTQVAEGEARRSALHDLLTDLPNRSLFNDRLEHALADAKRNSLNLAVMFIDLDNFKQINDAHGHHTGDRMLRMVAERLESSVRANDTVSRHGGDEFLYLCMGVEKKIDVVNIALKLFDAISAAFESDGTKLIVRPSIGIAIYPNDGETAEVLLKNADTAMYKAKQRKTGISFFSDINSA